MRSVWLVVIFPLIGFLLLLVGAAGGHLTEVQHFGDDGSGSLDVDWHLAVGLDHHRLRFLPPSKDLAIDIGDRFQKGSHLLVVLK
jgi:hypothetical protein